MAGVPIYRDAEFGLTGSYRIRREFYFPQVGLTDQECLDLTVLTRAAESGSIPLLKGMCEVRDKLLSTLPAKQQDMIRDASELFEVLSLNMAEHQHCSQIMLALQQALLTRKKVECHYRSPHERKSKILRLQPRRVFLARQSWYVAARDDKDGKDKLFRLPRFKTVRVLTESMKVPEDWSLRDMLGNAWGVMKGDRDYHVEILFEPDVAELVAEVKWHDTMELTTNPDGSLVFRATVAGLDEIVWWVLGWGPKARVIKPTELAIKVKELAMTTAERYARAPAQKASR